MEKIIVFGSSGHARVIINSIEYNNKDKIIGIIDKEISNRNSFCGYEILGIDTDLDNILQRNSGCKGIVAIGDSWIRHLVVEKIKLIDPNFRFIKVIHPSAVISRDVTIGEGSVVMAGVVINSNTSIGEHCIINTRSSIDHDCKIGNFVSILPGATIGGKVIMEDFSILALGGNIIHNLKVSEHTVIGAGATVLSDVPPYVVAYGVPAKVIRKREKGEKYL